MPPFDWMFDPAFRDSVRAQVANSSRSAGITSYDDVIVDALMDRLESNREKNRKIETDKPTGRQRTKTDALKSVDFLIRQASQVATRDRRTNLTLGDFKTAAQEHHCKFWPFC